MAQQTAVEWLEKQLDNNLDIKHSWRTKQYIEKAKEMEKEQMQKMYNHAMLSLVDTGHGESFEQYYNETYGK